MENMKEASYCESSDTGSKNTAWKGPKTGSQIPNREMTKSRTVQLKVIISAQEPSRGCFPIRLGQTEVTHRPYVACGPTIE